MEAAGVGVGAGSGDLSSKQLALVQSPRLPKEAHGVLDSGADGGLIKAGEKIHSSASCFWDPSDTNWNWISQRVFSSVSSCPVFVLFLFNHFQNL